jgi:flagellar hook assembly protein FlgD
MQVFNINGALVRNLLDAYHTAGTYAITWDGNDDRKRSCASGAYFLELSLPSGKGGEIRTAMRKMLLTR